MCSKIFLLLVVSWWSSSSWRGLYCSAFSLHGKGGVKSRSPHSSAAFFTQTTPVARLLSTMTATAVPRRRAAAYDSSRISTRRLLHLVCCPLAGTRDDDDNTSSSTLSAWAEEHRQDWINRSVQYYSKVMREERRRNLGQVLVEDVESPTYQDQFMSLAARHYFALRKIKDGKPRHAELIYRRIIDNLLSEEEENECDHAKLAVTTLLLALLLQRNGASAKQTRSVFLTFFRVVSMDDAPLHHHRSDNTVQESTSECGEQHHHHKQCACSAKVIGAFALFEMKQGNTLKSLQLARRAFQMDPTVMQPLLNWKQFRDAAQRQQHHHRFPIMQQHTTNVVEE